MFMRHLGPLSPNLQVMGSFSRSGTDLRYKFLVWFILHVDELLIQLLLHIISDKHRCNLQKHKLNILPTRECFSRKKCLLELFWSQFLSSLSCVHSFLSGLHSFWRMIARSDCLLWYESGVFSGKCLYFCNSFIRLNSSI